MANSQNLYSIASLTKNSAISRIRVVAVYTGRVPNMRDVLAPPSDAYQNKYYEWSGIKTYLVLIHVVVVISFNVETIWKGLVARQRQLLQRLI